MGTGGTQGAGASLQYGFAAAFVRVRGVTLERRPGAPILDVGEVASADQGDFWVVDRAACDVKIFAPDGRLRHVLRGRSRLADLCAPVGLAPFHGSYMAVLDAGTGRVHFYDVRARRQGGFDVPQVEQPLHIRSLADGRLAVVGRGGDGNGRWVHLYRPDGAHAESVFRAPALPLRELTRSATGVAADPDHAAPHSAAAGRSLWLAYGPAASVVLYDFGSRLVHSFPLETGVRPADAASVCGIYAAHGGRVIVMYRTADAEARYAYDLYTAAGEPVLANVRSPQRLVGVEGKLFYSIDAGAGNGEGSEAGADAWRLRVCRLRDLV